MKEKMLKFVEIGQQSPPKRKKEEISEDFNEIYKEFINDNTIRAIFFDHWKSIENINQIVLNKTKPTSLNLILPYLSDLTGHPRAPRLILPYLI